MEEIKPQVEASRLENTPVGTVLVVLKDKKIRQVKLNCEDPESWLNRHYPGAQFNGKNAQDVVNILEKYFSRGDPSILSDVEISFECAHTPFVESIYNSLRQVNFGQTITYGELATKAGHPGAARAVGSAMARNPVPLFIPCHRVLPANGCLGGFTGGVHLKRKLLELEKVELLPEY